MSTTRNIASSTFPAIGFGAMGISAFYGAVEPDEERFKVLDAAHASGSTFWDTADIYADSEELLGKWFKRTGKRADIFLATKFGFVLEDSTVNGTPEYVRKSAESSLKRLEVDYIDLYYMHRADPKTPIEVSVRAMAELVKEGKVKYLGLSEVSASTLRRAHAVHPISALQVEYSPFTLDIEDPKIDLLRTARELGVKIVAYSPLGRGLLTGQYRSPDDFAADDFRRFVPRYSAANFPNILHIADSLKVIGAKYETASGKPATAGQVALAWVLGQGNDVIAIPGTKKIKYLLENISAGEITLTPEDMAAVRELAVKADAEGQKAGPRYPEAMWAQMFVETPVDV
ncbi:Aldo-ket-red domain-containing protein [Mycena indigotica]|uniref:Aldo-ket-red domain-containing protein n=1 Tax=Mycena indigotica TaxID=2126181 RepID=A0A8H6S1B1_9AGAR|nr:Aldo-ket-red domain-containing protein [Mycena indigotica]KAF7290833.1 Aldo-ket-red domain-containing protein [Mycena indigotica]